MKKLILIKYGELTTKKDNRNLFIKILKTNILNKIKNFNPKITYDYFRMFIEVNDKNFEVVIDELTKVFGIHEITTAYFDEDRTVETIKSHTLEILNKEKFNTFKIVTNRSDKSYEIKSMEMNNILGGFILKNINNIKVDVHNPEILINVEIRHEGVYIYKNGIEGLKGYPVGTQGKALCMLSGGIDSPVASYLTLKRGIRQDYIYFESIPHTSLEARNKVIKLASIVSNYNTNAKVYIINFTKIQESIYKNCKEEYLITIMRRMMYRISERLAIKNKYLAIINGESVGQVASQTLTSIKVINEVTNFPILRPLCSFDKLEIIDISKKINTYETSILPYEDCCTIFVPKHPVINPNINIVREEEEKLNIDLLLEEVFENIIVINIEHIEEDSEYL